MIACDFVVGFIGSRMLNNAKGGGILEKKNYMGNTMNEDVIIFGSSRAYRHYDPDILEDSLGLTVYNCGLSAYSIIGNYGFYKIVKERYNPKIIIYEIYNTDLMISDNHKYLGELRYLYDRVGVDSIFWNVDRTERYKMVSKMYRFNSTFPEMTREFIKPSQKFRKGAIMTNKKMISEPKPIEKHESFKYDSLKLYYLERLIKDCDCTTQIIFTVSPMYENTDERMLEPVKALCNKYNIPLISHYTDSSFNNKREYFYDRIHMNRDGATAYSKVVAGEIKKVINGK